MTTPTLYQYDSKTGEFLHSRPAQTRPNGDPILDVIGATPTAPPADIPAKHVACWTGEDWEIVEDHRQTMDEQGRMVEGTGTDYWLPPEGDTYQSAARHMTQIGPLPAGAQRTCPEKPASALADELRATRNARISATDYLMAVDYPLSDEARATVTAYRQALRDLPQQEGFPWLGGGADDVECPWPVHPA